MSDGHPIEPIERMVLSTRPGEVDDRPNAYGFRLTVPEPVLRATDNLTGPEREMLASVLQSTTRRFLEEHLARLLERSERIREALREGHEFPLAGEEEEIADQADGQNGDGASPPPPPEPPDSEPPAATGEAPPDGSAEEPDDPAAPDVLQALEEISEPATVNALAKHLGMHYSPSGVLSPGERRILEEELADLEREGQVRTAGTYKRGVLWEPVPEDAPAALAQLPPTKGERAEQEADAIAEEVWRALANGSLLVPTIATKIDRPSSVTAQAVQRLCKTGRAYKVPGGAYERITEPA